MRVQNIRETFAKVSQNRRPIGRLKGVLPAQAKLRPSQTIRRVNGRPELGSFGADSPQVGRRRLDAAHLGHPRFLPLEAQATPHSAVGTNRLAKQLQIILLRVSAQG